MKPTFRLNSVSACLALTGLLALASCDMTSSKEKSAADDSTDKQQTQEDEFVVSQRLVNNDGAFQLLTIIEGADANERFVQNLQLVQAQRAILAKLEAEPEKNEETQKKIEEIRAKLEENNELMAKIYGYGPKANYAFFPVRSAIVRENDGKRVLVKRIDSPKRHQAIHMMLGKHAAVVQQHGESSEEAKAIAAELLETFGFDLNAGHRLEVGRGALYLKLEE